jgi:2-octaprenylphenol hydroxylase
MNAKARPDTEVAICGGGPVGSALAGLLSAQGIECILVEARASGASSGSADPRALALTPASIAILESIDAWRRLGRESIGEFTRMEVWDESGSGRIEFDCADLCAPSLGCIVPQAALQQALDAALERRPRIAACRGTAPAAVHWGRDFVELDLDDGTRISARLLVAADGFSSRLREMAGIALSVHEYDQRAVACTVRTAAPHGRVARQRFLRRGPLAFLPLAEPDQCGIVWSTVPDHAAELLRMEPEQFHGELAAAFQPAPGAILESGARASFPLRRAHAERYCRNRLVLAGDAAHCVHPLAGQGANLGLLDAASLAEVLAAARARGRDIGELSVLRRYERWRRGENALMIGVLEALHGLFGAESATVARIRNAGLDLVNAAVPLKHLIMRRAMGIAGDLPAVARPRFG